jgi:hypothetical protein
MIIIIIINYYYYYSWKCLQNTEKLRVKGEVDGDTFSNL